MWKCVTSLESFYTSEFVKRDETHTLFTNYLRPDELSNSLTTKGYENVQMRMNHGRKSLLNRLMSPVIEYLFLWVDLDTRWDCSKKTKILFPGVISLGLCSTKSQEFCWGSKSLTVLSLPRRISV